MTALTVADLDVALGGTPILDDVTFAIDPGQTVALLGDNGSGKSTLLKAVLGLVRHQRGTITLLGQNLAGFHAWRRVGYVPQRAAVALHSVTVREVVGTGALAQRSVGWLTRADRCRVAEALDTVDLAAHADEAYVHLSGGQQQRALIARGLVNHPDLLLLDEPFAGVDLTSQARIAATLAASPATVLVVLHEIGAMAAHLGRALVLREGRLEYDGPATDLATGGTHEVNRPDRRHLLTGMEPRWTS